MLIYKCRVTGDEMISDAYDLRPVLDAEGNPVAGGQLIECESLQVRTCKALRGGGNVGT